MKAYTRMEIALRQVVRVECVEAPDVTTALAMFDRGEAVLLKETMGPPLQQNHELKVSEGWFSEPGLAREHYQKIHDLVGAEDRGHIQAFLNFVYEALGPEVIDGLPDHIQQGHGILIDILAPEGIDEQGGSADV